MTPPKKTIAPVDPLVAERISMAWRELRRGAAMNVLREQLFGTGADALDPGQMDTLDLLVTRKQWRMSEIAEALRVEPSTATRAISRLVQTGLAERCASDTDGRVVLVSATKAGRDKHDSVTKVRQQFFGKLLDQFSPSTAEEIASALSTLVAGIDVAVAKLQEESDSG